MNKEITINPLPSKTWNFLRVNDRRLSLPSEVKSIKGNVILKDGISLFSEEDINGNISDILAENESAMGKEFFGLIKEYPAELVFIKDGNDKEDFTADVKTDICYHDPGVLSVSKTKIVVKEGSSFTVVMNFTDDSKGVSADEMIYAASETRAYLEKGARLSIVQIFDLSDNTCMSCDISSALEENAEIKVIHVMISGKSTNVACLANLIGDGSRAQFKTGYSVGAGEILDMNYIARQRGKNTDADIAANGVLTDKAEKLYRTTVDFVRGCSGSSGKEEEKVLLLDENVVNKTVPLILCTEEAVSGEHGASIGSISEEILYYMASRGIDRKKARSIMANSGLLTAAEIIPDQDIRQKLIARLQSDEEIE